MIGYVPEQSPINEEYVATMKIEQWLQEGKSATDIALTWNQGHPGKCRRGVNRYGVNYDSCAYVAMVKSHL